MMLASTARVPCLPWTRLEQNRDWFIGLHDTEVVAGHWRGFYNHHRPCSVLGYRPPAVVRTHYECENTVDRPTSAVAKTGAEGHIGLGA